MKGKGREFEDVACLYLIRIGYKVLKRNVHCRYGEIDILALDGDTLVFVEVKGGAGHSSTDPAYRMDTTKLAKILKCAEKLMAEFPAQDCRIDLLVIRGSEVEHLKNISL